MRWYRAIKSVLFGKHRTAGPSLHHAPKHPAFLPGLASATLDRRAIRLRRD